MRLFAKTWWVWGILAMAAGVVNPYTAIYIFAFFMMIFANSVFILIGKAGQVYRETNTLQGFIARLHTWIFWVVPLFNVFLFFILAYINIKETYWPGFAPRFQFFSLPYDTVPVTTLSVITCTLLHALSTFLVAVRLYDVFWRGRK